MASWLSHLRRVNRRNLETFRKAPLAEISGSLGDLGTLLPLMIALAMQNSIQLGSTLVFTGLFNVLTGLYFGIPLPVQPMKAIASAAISRKIHQEEVISAGQWVGGAVLFMSVTGLLRRAVTVVPLPVVKGVQLGAGLSLITSVASYLPVFDTWPGSALDNPYWSIFAFVVLVGTQKMPRFPYAFCFFVLAIIFALIRVMASGDRLPWLHIWRPYLATPGGIGIGVDESLAMNMALGQLPLTTLNSIIAVCALSQDLIPDLPAPTVTAMGLSIAMMNLSGTWLGGMPVCHGAGGLAAQYRFGARSGASVIFLGVLKILLGLFFGEALVDLLSQYPKSFLGVMVLAAGLELAKAASTLNDGASDLWQASPGHGYEQSGLERRPRELGEEERLERWNVMLMTTAGIVVFKNDALGFFAGMLCHWSYRWHGKYNRWRSRTSSLGTDERTALLRG